MKIMIFTTGGTIDKIYFDQKSTYQVGDSKIESILGSAQVQLDFTVQSLLRKDSLDLTEQDRQCIAEAVQKTNATRVLITHGTDTMVETAKVLDGLTDKTIVLTGSLTPALFEHGDATFNIASALMAVQLLPAGVYIAMHGEIFDPHHTRKNHDKNCFERLNSPRK